MPVSWGSYIYGAGMSVSNFPTNFAPCNAAYVDGRVERYAATASTYVNLGPVTALRLYVPAKRD